jgi:ligand-binding SRPBCC domain-containing protein
MRHTFETSQWVPYPPAQVFAFFSDPRNLPPLMPAWQRARIEHAFLAAPPMSQHQWNKTAETAGSGSVLTISFRALPFAPVRLKWVAVIDEFLWNDHFCDTQRSGPLAYWHHCHYVKAEQQEDVPGTRVTDKLTYALPLGFLGDMANGVAIHRQVKATFAYRQRQLLKLLPGRS